MARYEELYDRSGLPSEAYEGRITGQIAQLCRVYGMECGAPEVARSQPRASQLALV
ncbi:hypothetical protein GCM10020220_023110 [Nonomuraea rubra]|uniref:hypothetical protein n=1 Tax=Nonomuraea rubra TaxID=46180 RepID=UPI0031E8E78D